MTKRYSVTAYYSRVLESGRTYSVDYTYHAAQTMTGVHRIANTIRNERVRRYAYDPAVKAPTDWEPAGEWLRFDYWTPLGDQYRVLIFWSEND